MGYLPVRYDSRVVNYKRRGFIRLDTVHGPDPIRLYITSAHLVQPSGV